VNVGLIRKNWEEVQNHRDWLREQAAIHVMGWETRWTKHRRMGYSRLWAKEPKDRGWFLCPDFFWSMNAWQVVKKMQKDGYGCSVDRGSGEDAWYATFREQGADSVRDVYTDWHDDARVAIVNAALRAKGIDPIPNNVPITPDPATD
jgi:hypothetical protein